MSASAPPTPPRRAFVVLPLAWAAFILVSTLTPANSMPPTPHWELLAFDTAAHAFVFGVLAVLATFSARRQRWWPGLRARAFGTVLVAAIGMGAAIELLQMGMDLGRNGEWSDILSDALGVVAGSALMWFTRRFWQ
ncbi:VanZ family protein [Hymenobacter rubripertinctus]|uniref:VanZ family protein n=1 Tax=Hymenobacter rubripertinctus TaxID=2029981 RepID=A0A418QUJ9_9BACT|nr:VanZ family protein [Hymenobacter rubripertinctus]RIY08899.1 VanZ family protein [Hymenobacter rubripertinctus]